MAHDCVDNSHGRVEDLAILGKFPEKPQGRVGGPVAGLMLWPGWAHSRLEFPHGRV